MHFKICVKSIRNREFLKPERLAKLTEVGKLFHTRTILSAKNRLRVLWLQCDLYSLYAWPLGHTVKFEKVGEIKIYQAKNDFIAIY